VRMRARRSLLVAGILLVSMGAAPGTPDREAAYRENNRGVAHLERYEHREAVAAFRRAITLDPGLALARSNLAIALFYLPDVAAARQEAREAQRLDPRLPHPHYIEALAARLEDRLDEAAAAFRRVLELDTGDLGANLALGQLLIDQDRPEEALFFLETALRAEPFNASAAYNVAVGLSVAGRREEAQAAMARFQALRRSPYHTAQGQKYLEQGRYAEAVASSGAEADLVDRSVPDVRFVETALPTPTAASSTLAHPRLA